MRPVDLVGKLVGNLERDDSKDDENGRNAKATRRYRTRGYEVDDINDEKEKEDRYEKTVYGQKDGERNLDHT